MSESYLVFGAAGGIGSSLCRLIRERGGRVALAGRTEEKLAPLAGELEAPAYAADATDPGAVAGVTARAAEELEGLDGVANCVGSVFIKPAHLTTIEEWNDTIAKNLTSSFAVVSAAAKTMRKTGGSVVLISSAAARTGIPSHGAIAAAKGGVIGLALSAAATYARAKIRFNVVAPGLVKTPATAKITGSKAASKASESMHPLGRLGSPEDVASAILFLLEPEQSWITGQVLGVDGGLAGLKVR